MIVRINKAFEKDISKIKDQNVLSKVYSLIIQIQKIDELNKIRNLKRLKGEHNYYRIRMGICSKGIKMLIKK